MSHGGGEVCCCLQFVNCSIGDGNGLPLVQQQSLVQKLLETWSKVPPHAMFHISCAVANVRLWGMENFTHVSSGLGGSYHGLRESPIVISSAYVYMCVGKGNR